MTPTQIARSWLQTLYGDCDPGQWVTLGHIDRSRVSAFRTVWAPLTPKGLDKLAETALQLNTSCVWVGCGTRTQAAYDHSKETNPETGRPYGGRGESEHCHQFPGLWVDIDYGDKHKSTKALPADDVEALKLLERFPLEPSALIHSGWGFQAWWLFDEPEELTADYLEQWHDTWRAIGAEHGCHVDNVFDKARVMRLPGTHHRKDINNPIPVTVEFETDDRYGLMELEDCFREGPPKPVYQGSVEPLGSRPTDGQGRPGDEFNEQITCEQVLERNGWAYAFTDRIGTHWVRPGKTVRQGTSATVYARDGKVIVWTDAVAGIEARDDFDPFGLMARLEHGGDIKAAATALKQDGYGSALSAVERLLADYAVPPPPTPPATAESEGSPSSGGTRPSKKRKKNKKAKKRQSSASGTHENHSSAVSQASSDLGKDQKNQPAVISEHCTKSSDPKAAAKQAKTKAEKKKKKGKKPKRGSGSKAAASSSADSVVDTKIGPKSPKSKSAKRDSKSAKAKRAAATSKRTGGDPSGSRGKGSKGKDETSEGIGKSVTTSDREMQPVSLWVKRTPKPLPLQHMPTFIADTCHHLGEVFQVPPDVPFVAELGALSLLATEARQTIQIKTSWQQQANLYLVLVGESGLGKSPPVSLIEQTLEPIADQIEAASQEAAAEYNDEAEQLKAQIDSYKRQITDIETKGPPSTTGAPKIAKAERDHLNRLRQHQAELTPVAGRQLTADDLTPESFAELLHRNGGRLGFISSEGELLKATARYTNETQLGPLLKGWSGDTITVNRKTNKEYFKIKGAAVTIAIMVQPYVIERLYGDSEAVGTGLASRFMMSYPTTTVGSRNFIEAPDADPALVETLTRLHTKLGSLSPNCWPMTKGARQLYLEWMNANEAELRPGGAYAPTSEGDILGQYVNKVHSSVARLALIWHLCGDRSPLDYDVKVSKKPVAQAIEMGEYWLDHAAAMRDNASPPALLKLAESICFWAKNKGLTEFTKRDVMRANVGSKRVGGKKEGVKAPEVDAALILLAANGWGFQADLMSPFRFSDQVLATPEILDNLLFAPKTEKMKEIGGNIRNLSRESRVARRGIFLSTTTSSILSSKSVSPSPEGNKGTPPRDARHARQDGRVIL